MAATADKLIIASPDAKYALSSDGISFTQYSFPASGAGPLVMASPTHFMVRPPTAAYVWISSDGVNWAEKAFPVTTASYVGWLVKDRFLILTANTGYYIQAADGGGDWQMCSVPVTIGAAQNGHLRYNTTLDRFCALSYNYTKSMASTDGVTWTASADIGGYWLPLI